MDLLLVIDMQNAYTEAGPWTCPGMGRAAAAIGELIEKAPFGEIIFTRFDAPAEPVGSWKRYNEINKEVSENAFLNEIVPEMQEYARHYPLYSKSTYSSLTVPEVREAVEACIRRGGSLVVTGVVSECCVLATALEAVDRGCPLIFIPEACAGVSEAAEQAAETVLAGLAYAQTEILSKEEYLRRAAEKKQ